MRYPEVEIVDYNNSKPNIQRWGRKGDNEYEGRIVSKVKIGELPKGWKLVGVSEWQLISQGEHYRKGKWAGNIKANIIEMGTEFSPDNFDQKAVKFGGRFRNIYNFSIKLRVVIAFKNDKRETVTGAWETKYTTPHQTTGKVEQSKTVLKFHDFEPETPEPEEPEKPEPAKDIYVVLSFYWRDLKVAFAQSMLFWKKFWKVPTHGDFGLSDTVNNLSATGKGVKLIERVPSKLLARKYKEFRIKLTPEEVEKTRDFYRDHLGKDYNYYFYPRWALNTYLIPSIMLALFGLITGHLWLDYILIGLYVPVNFVLWLLSRGKYACTQLMAKYCNEVLNIDFGYGKSYQDASPYDMLKKIEFLQNMKGREII